MKARIKETNDAQGIVNVWQYKPPIQGIPVWV